MSPPNQTAPADTLSARADQLASRLWSIVSCLQSHVDSVLNTAPRATAAENATGVQAQTPSIESSINAGHDAADVLNDVLANLRDKV